MRRKRMEKRSFFKKTLLLCVDTLILIFFANAFIVFYEAKHDNETIISHNCDEATRCNCSSEKKNTNVDTELDSVPQSSCQNVAVTISGDRQIATNNSNDKQSASIETSSAIISNTTPTQPVVNSVPQNKLKPTDPFMDGKVAGYYDVHSNDEYGNSSILTTFWYLQGTEYARLWIDRIDDKYVWGSSYLELSNNAFVTTEKDHWSNGKDSYKSVNLPKAFNTDWDYMARTYGMRLRPYYVKSTGRTKYSLVFTFGGKEYVFLNSKERRVVKPECRWNSVSNYLDSNTTIEIEGKVTPWFSSVYINEWKVYGNDDIKIVSATKDDSGIMRIKLETGNIKYGADRATLHACGAQWNFNFTGKGYRRDATN